jgi:hypothetical protein
MYALMPRWLLFAVQSRVHHPSAYPLSPDFPRLHQKQWPHQRWPIPPGLCPSASSKTRDKYLHIDATVPPTQLLLHAQSEVTAKDFNILLIKAQLAGSWSLPGRLDAYMESKC